MSRGQEAAAWGRQLGVGGGGFTGPLITHSLKKGAPYLSMNLLNPYSSILARHVVSVGFISQPTSSLICKEMRVRVYGSRQRCPVDMGGGKYSCPLAPPAATGTAEPEVCLVGLDGFSHLM